MEDDSGEKIVKVDETDHNLGCGPDAELGWQKEALAVIRDIENHVKFISVADNIKVIVRLNTRGVLLKIKTGLSLSHILFLFA